jgi:sugar phosphate permease
LASCSASVTARSRLSIPRISAYQIAQVYGGGLIPIVAGLILKSYGIKEAYLYIGGLVMVYGLLAIYAIIVTPETKGSDLEGLVAAE